MIPTWVLLHVPLLDELIMLFPSNQSPKSFLHPPPLPRPLSLSLLHLTAMQMEADASRLDSGHSAALRAKSRSGPVCHELPRRQVNCGRFQPSITMKRFPSSLRAERGPQKPGDKVCWESERPGWRAHRRWRFGQ